MATTTLQAIREEIIDQYGLGRRGEIDAGTASSTTQLTDDTNFGGHSAAEDVEPGCYVRITSGGSAPDESVTRLASRPVRTTGVMTLDPPLANAVAASVTFEVLYKPFSYTDAFGLHPAINKALEIIPEKLMVPITAVTDGDMLASAVASWGTASNCAAAKSAAAFPYALRELQVTNSAANGYQPSAAIPVDSSTGYYLEATARVTNAVATATARLDCSDLTNAVDLTVDNDNTTQQEPYILASTVTTGSATERVEIRLGADQNSVVSLWSNVIFRRNDAKEFVIQDRAQVDRLGQLMVANGATWATRTWQDVGAELETRTEGLWVYRTHTSLSGYSVWYEEYRKAAALTADADTSSASVEDVAAIAAEILLQPLAEKDRWRPLYLKAARRAAVARTKYAAQQSIVNTAPRNVALPVV